MPVPRRIARPAVVLLAGALAVGLAAPAVVAAGSAPVAAPGSRLAPAALLPTTIAGFPGRTASVNQGSTFPVRATVSGPGRRVVVLQRLSGRRWVNVVTTKSSARRAVVLNVKSPAAGTFRYRLVVPRVGLFAARVSGVKVVVVKKRELRLLPRVITGSFSGEDPRATWGGTLELTARNGTTNSSSAYFKVSEVYEVTKLSGTWAWKANQGGQCTRSGGGAIALADVLTDTEFANGVSRPVSITNYFDPWASVGRGPIYDFRIRFTNAVRWPYTDTCPDPYDGPPDVRNGQEGPPFHLLATADGIDTVAGLQGPVPTSDGSTFSGTLTNYQRTTFSWNLSGELGFLYPRPGT